MGQLTRVMWFHALQCMYKERPPLEIDIPVFRNDDPFSSTSWPKCMAHRSPWFLWVCTEVGLPILADLETGSCARYRKVDYTSIVRR